MLASSRILTSISALIVACGVLCLAGQEPASAATPACGISCTDVVPQQTGPLDAAAVQDITAQTGQDIILFPFVPDAAEDFTLLSLGTVAGFYTAGIVGPAVGLTWPSDNVYEYEYSPDGIESGLCTGVAVTAVNGTPVTLQPCGITAKTLWITLAADVIGGYQPLINGSDTVTAAPYVLTAGAVKGVLITQQLYLAGGAVARTQMWQNFAGVP